MQHLDLSIRGELVQTVVEEREWRMELEHLTLQQNREIIVITSTVLSVHAQPTRDLIITQEREFQMVKLIFLAYQEILVVLPKVIGFFV